MSYVRLMLLSLKANRCLFPSQLASSLTFITEALQLPEVEATCRSASIKAFYLLRVIPCHVSSYISVQTHFTAATALQWFFSLCLGKVRHRFLPVLLKLCRYLIFHSYSQVWAHCASKVYDLNVTLLGFTAVSCSQPTGTWCRWSSHGILMQLQPSLGPASQIPFLTHEIPDILQLVGH